MKSLLFFIIAILFAVPVTAQTAIAKIKYEQAEEAFVKNDYPTTVRRLDEAEKLLGSSNPKILYLRLMAAKGIINGGKYDYDFLAGVRKDAQFYLNKYSEVQGIEEKFRDVYNFSEDLEKLPNTKALYVQKETEAAEKRNDWLKFRPVQVSDSLLAAYGVKRCASVQEFQTYNPGAFAGLKRFKNPTKEITAAFYNNFNYSAAGPSLIYFDAKGLRVYSFIVQGNTDSETAKKIYNTLVGLYPPEMSKEWAELKEITKDMNGAESGYFSIKPLATGNRGSILMMYTSYLGTANVQITFNPQ